MNLKQNQRLKLDAFGHTLEYFGHTLDIRWTYFGRPWMTLEFHLQTAGAPYCVLRKRNNKPKPRFNRR